jgi:hypothetical protein
LCGGKVAIREAVIMSATFLEFLGHRKYGGITVMQAFNAIEIAAPSHTRRIKGNPTHIENVQEYQRYIKRHDGKAQVYIGLNPVKPDTKGFPFNKDVMVWTNELLDLDLEKPKLIDEDVPDGYPQEYKHYAAREDDLGKLEPFIAKINGWLTDHGLKPGYQDRTGNGYRWILPIPGLDLTGHDLEALTTKKKEFKERIARECGIVDGCGVHLDSVFDFRRITGVPGTLNYKLETETRKNRTREPFRSVTRDEDAALRDHILAIDVQKTEPRDGEQTLTPHQNEGLGYWLERDAKLKRLHGGDTSGYTSRSDAEMALAVKLVYYRFDAPEIEDVLLAAGIGKAKEEKKRGNLQYIEKTIKKAFEFERERVQEKKTAPEPADLTKLTKLSTALPVSDSAAENARTATDFTDKHLGGLNDVERTAFIESELKEHLRLSPKVVTQLLRRMPKNDTPETTDTTGSIIDLLPYRERAMEIMRDGDPTEYILNTLSKFHLGDKETGAVLMLSRGAQSNRNSDGLQPNVSGGTGKGKTDVCKAISGRHPTSRRKPHT